MFGHESAGEIAGRSILDCGDPGEHARLPRSYREQLAGRQAALQLDAVGRRADGSCFDLRMSAGLSRADDEYRLVLVVSDITAERSERARLEAENTTLARGMGRIAEGVITSGAGARLPLLRGRTAVGAVNLGRCTAGEPEPALLAALAELQPQLAGRVADAGRPPAWREAE